VATIKLRRRSVLLTATACLPVVQTQL